MRLTGKLRFDKPIIQAGMAGGITTPDLVAAVAEAGALGTIGAGYMNAAVLRQEIKQVKRLTNKPFAVNLFAAKLGVSSHQVAKMQHILNRFRTELNINPGQEYIEVHDNLQEKINVILEEDIPIVSTAFGILPSRVIEQLKQNKVALIGMATNLDEARQLVAAGYDVIVAQGSEAGGHRGTFHVDKFSDGCNIGLMVLVQEFLEHLFVPIVAAGGIYNKKQVDALLSMGVAGVQLGTRFLVATEAGTNSAYRQALIKATGDETVITNVFSGRPARAIYNRFVDEVTKSGVAPLPYPIQNEMTKDIRSAAKKSGIADFQSLWAGQGVGSVKKEETAAAIIDSLV